jgi:hypothetical protein
MELCQQFPRLRHHNQYRPMLGRSRHASELQRLLGVLTIFFYFGANHALCPVSRTLITAPRRPNCERLGVKFPGPTRQKPALPRRSISVRFTSMSGYPPR